MYIFIFIMVHENRQVSQYRWCETERTESPLLVPVNASCSCTTTSAAMVIITAYRVRMQAANKCISTSAATEVRCSDVEMRGVGTAPTLTAAAAPAPVLSPRMVGPWLRGSVPSPPAPSSVVST